MLENTKVPTVNAFMCEEDDYSLLGGKTIIIIAEISHTYYYIFLMNDIYLHYHVTPQWYQPSPSVKFESQECWPLEWVRYDQSGGGFDSGSYHRVKLSPFQLHEKRGLATLTHHWEVRVAHQPNEVLVAATIICSPPSYLCTAKLVLLQHSLRISWQASNLWCLNGSWLRIRQYIIITTLVTHAGLKQIPLFTRLYDTKCNYYDRRAESKGIHNVVLKSVLYALVWGNQ